MRRAADLAIGALALLLSFPLLLLAAVAIRLSDRGPIVYRAMRVGAHGTTFTLYKLRTMRPAVGGAALTVPGDDRVTTVGRRLRRWRIDELPQLVNVIRGDMTLIGPRPEDPRYVAAYAPHHRLVLDVKPGLVPAAFIVDEDAMLKDSADPETTYIRDVLPLKLDVEAAYLRERSLRRDLTVIATALRYVVGRRPG